MRHRLSRPGRSRRIGGRNHCTKPWLQAQEPRWPPPRHAAPEPDHGKLPMSFQLNEGQTNPEVSFLSQGNGYTLFLTPTESVLSLQTPSPPPAPPGADAAASAPDSVLSMQLIGASAAPQV